MGNNVRTNITNSQGWGAGDRPYNRTIPHVPEVPEVGDAADLQRLLQERPQDALRLAQRLLREEGQGKQLSFRYLQQMFGESFESYRNDQFALNQENRFEQSQSRMALLGELLNRLKDHPVYGREASALLAEYERISGFNELESTFRSGTGILGRNSFERMGAFISLGSSVAGSLGGLASAYFGMRGNLGMSIASGVANALFQSGLQLLHQYGEGSDLGNRQIAGELGEAAAAAVACSFVAYGAGRLEGMGLVTRESSLLIRGAWGLSKFWLDVGAEYLCNGWSPVKRLLGLEPQGFASTSQGLAYGLVANALGEILGDAAGHLAHPVTHHIEHRTEALVNRALASDPLLREYLRSQNPANEDENPICHPGLDPGSCGAQRDSSLRWNNTRSYTFGSIAAGMATLLGGELLAGSDVWANTVSTLHSSSSSASWGQWILSAIVTSLAVAGNWVFDFQLTEETGDDPLVGSTTPSTESTSSVLDPFEKENEGLRNFATRIRDIQVRRGVFRGAMHGDKLWEAFHTAELSARWKNNIRYLIQSYHSTESEEIANADIFFDVMRALPTFCEVLYRSGLTGEQIEANFHTLVSVERSQLAEVLSNFASAYEALGEVAWTSNEKNDFLTRLAVAARSQAGLVFSNFCVVFKEYRVAAPNSEIETSEILEYLALKEIFTVIIIAQNREGSRRDIESTLPAQIKKIKTALGCHTPSLAQLCELTQSLPSADLPSINRLRWLAIQIQNKMNSPEGDYFRQQIHNFPSPKNIELIRGVLFLEREKSTANLQGIAHLEEALTLAQQIYLGNFNLALFRRTLGGSLREGIQFPTAEEVSPERLAQLAIATRRFWEDQRKLLTPQECLYLAQLSVALQRFAFAHAAYQEGEVPSASQAQRMALLIATLYGSGYGNEGWLAVARELNALQAQWNELSAFKREERLRRQAVLAREMARKVRSSYQDNLGPLVVRYGESLGLAEQDQADYVAAQYRAMAVFQLGRHSDALAGIAAAGDPKVAQQVLELLSSPWPEVEYRPYFPGDEDFPKDRRITGGKAAGLAWLRKHRPQNTAPFFVLPAQNRTAVPQTEAALAQAQSRLSQEAARELKIHPGELRFAVRSGACISMPGILSTELDVSSAEIAEASAKVHQSWRTANALEYRRMQGIPDSWGSAVVVVPMLDYARDRNSGSGVVVSSGVNEIDVTYGCQKPGEAIVAASLNQKSDPLPGETERQLREDIASFEQKRGEPVEVEFVVVSGHIWYLQIRRANLNHEEAIRWYARKLREKRISQEFALERLGGRPALEEARVIHEVVIPTDPRALIYEGRPGIGAPYTGRIAQSAKEIAEIQASGARAVYLASTGDSHDEVVNALQAGAVLLAVNADQSHLMAHVHRQNLPSLQGTKFEIKGRQINLAARSLQTGATVTIDPAHGRLYEGALSTREGPSAVLNDIEFLLNPEREALLRDSSAPELQAILKRYPEREALLRQAAEQALALYREAFVHFVYYQILSEGSRATDIHALYKAFEMEREYWIKLHEVMGNIADYLTQTRPVTEQRSTFFAFQSRSQLLLYLNYYLAAIAASSAEGKVHELALTRLANEMGVQGDQRDWSRMRQQREYELEFLFDFVCRQLASSPQFFERHPLRIERDFSEAKSYLRNDHVDRSSLEELRRKILPVSPAGSRPRLLLVGLGREWAQVEHAVAQGYDVVVVEPREELADYYEGYRERIEALASQGVQVETICADICDPTLFSQLGRESFESIEYQYASDTQEMDTQVISGLLKPGGVFLQYHPFKICREDLVHHCRFRKIFAAENVKAPLDTHSTRLAYPLGNHVLMLQKPLANRRASRTTETGLSLEQLAEFSTSPLEDLHYLPTQYDVATLIEDGLQHPLDLVRQAYETLKRQLFAVLPGLGKVTAVLLSLGLASFLNLPSAHAAVLSGSHMSASSFSGWQWVFSAVMTVAAAAMRVDSADILSGHVQNQLEDLVLAQEAGFEKERLVLGRDSLLDLTRKNRAEALELLLEVEEKRHFGVQLKEVVYAMGDLVHQGTPPENAFTQLSVRIRASQKPYFVYRGLRETELKVWQLAHALLQRVPNIQKQGAVQEFIDFHVRQSSSQIAEMGKAISLSLQQEEASSIRIGLKTRVLLYDLFRNLSMVDMFFSSTPEAVGEGSAHTFARMGGYMIRLALTVDGVLRMNPNLAWHVAIRKSDGNLEQLLNGFDPAQIYQKPHFPSAPIAEAVTNLTSSKRSDAKVLPIYLPPQLAELLQAVFRYSPSKHLLHYPNIRRGVDRIIECWKCGERSEIQARCEEIGTNMAAAFSWISSLGIRG
ncbi:MAG: hypothetical protein HQM15_00780 [Deltaproteobacteria bacterium]|nr:hypothetical protein [Deltaproteobacteria bacterium]